MVAFTARTGPLNGGGHPLHMMLLFRLSPKAGKNPNTEEKIIADGKTLKLRSHSADTRHNDTLSQEVSYASWTQNLSHDPPDACPTPDAPGVAACDHPTCGTSPTGPDVVTAG